MKNLFSGCGCITVKERATVIMNTCYSRFNHNISRNVLQRRVLAYHRITLCYSKRLKYDSFRPCTVW